MVADNEAPLGTAFTVSVDFRHGLTTGISAEERCNTVRALANPNAGADEFVRPGHIFPLIAREGGVLMRSGHTEAAVDLAGSPACRRSACSPNWSTTTAPSCAGREVAAFAEKHGLKQRFGRRPDRLPPAQREARQPRRRVRHRHLAGPAHAVAYRTEWDPTEHLAVVFGEIGDGRGVPVRLHREAVIDDVFAARSRLDRVMARFSAEPRRDRLSPRRRRRRRRRRRPRAATASVRPTKPKAPPRRANASGARSASAPRS